MATMKVTLVSIFFGEDVTVINDTWNVRNSCLFVLNCLSGYVLSEVYMFGAFICNS